jgi:hypothetical protein
MWKHCCSVNGVRKGNAAPLLETKDWTEFKNVLGQIEEEYTLLFKEYVRNESDNPRWCKWTIVDDLSSGTIGLEWREMIVRGYELLLRCLKIPQSENMTGSMEWCMEWNNHIITSVSLALRAAALTYRSCAREYGNSVSKYILTNQLRWTIGWVLPDVVGISSCIYPWSRQSFFYDEESNGNIACDLPPMLQKLVERNFVSQKIIWHEVWCVGCEDVPRASELLLEEYYILWSFSGFQGIKLALCSGLHGRLGEDSLLYLLDEDLLRYILGLCCRTRTRRVKA